MRIFTIGFTKTTARHFFERLKRSGARRLLDVRLNNVSQLSGFAKRDDLAFFAEALCGIDYEHFPQLAPTKRMLDDYRKNGRTWDDYESDFLRLMAERQIEEMNQAEIDNGCLLCSEDTPHFCHRRLVAEYLREKWKDVEVTHL